MKIKNLFMLGFVFVAALLASCTNKAGEEIGEEVLEPGQVKANGYLSINFKLPTSVAGKAANDDYDDGVVEEYVVDNIGVILFEGTSVADAKFHSAYAVVDYEEVPDVDGDNITTSYSKVLKVKGEVATGNHLYALAVINFGQIFAINQTDGSLDVNGETISKGKPFSEIIGLTTELPLYHSTGAGASRVDSRFFMTNAPLSKYAGGNAGIQTELDQVKTDKYAVVESLTRLNADVFWATEAAARENPAGSIFVERAVAKVTFSPDENLKYDAEYSDGSSEQEVVNFEEWTVDNVEKSTYVMRNMGSAEYLAYRQKSSAGTGFNPTFRFVGNVAMGVTSIQPVVQLFRTYWCVDPSYATDKEYNQVDMYTPETKAAYDKLDIAWRPINKPTYPHENTFDVAHQNYKNTSRAVIRAKLNGGHTFYTLNESEKIYKTLSDVQSFQEKYIIENGSIVDMLMEYVNPGKTVTVNDAVSISYARNEEGIWQVTDIKPNLTYYATHDDLFKAAPSFSDTEAKRTTISNIIKNCNSRFVVKAYINGVMYYEVRIMHFADPSNAAPHDLAPWSIAATSANLTSDAYPGADAAENYLGRYGMVRNNWYDIKVSAVKHLGSPVVPNANVTTSDDNKDEPEYLAFTINVLSWAKRIQPIEL